MTSNNQKRFPVKIILIALAVIVFLVTGTLLTRGENVKASTGKATYKSITAASGSSNQNGIAMMSTMDRTVMDTAEEADLMDSEIPTAAEEAETAESTEKIIRTASVSLKSTAFDTVLQGIRNLTAQAGGRIDSLNVYGEKDSGSRWAYLSLRIPSDQLDAFLNDTEALGVVTGYSENAENVTDTYYDLSSRLRVQQEKLASLEAMLPKAETISDVIQIESAIRDTQYLIDSYQGRLNGYDARISYSTVYVDLNEYTEAEPEKELSFGERIVKGLKDSLSGGAQFLRDMFVFLIAALPWLAGAALIITGAVFIVRKGRKNRGNSEK